MNWQQVQAQLYQQGWSPEVVVEATEMAREQQRRDEARRRQGVGPFQLKPETFRRGAQASAITATQVGEVFRAAGFEVQP